MKESKIMISFGVWWGDSLPAIVSRAKTQAVTAVFRRAAAPASASAINQYSTPGTTPQYAGIAFARQPSASVVRRSGIVRVIAVFAPLPDIAQQVM